MDVFFQMPSFVTILDFVGTFAFAISGIRLASAKRFDWFGAYVVGLATAIGCFAGCDSSLDDRPDVPHLYGFRHVLCHLVRKVCHSPE